MALAFILIEVLGLDLKIANTLFYDHARQHWLGAGAGDWWAHRLVHDTGRWLVRGVAAAALLVWGITFFVPSTRQWRRSAGFIVLAMAVSVLVVGLLKQVTNVDCPWDLAEYGGAHPYVALFADRPDYLPRAACFPGAHSSSGFALVCFYFVLRNRWRRLAWLALGIACLVGVVFSIGQEARGAHFLSHDLTSAMLVWAIQLYLYVRVLGLPANYSQTRASE
jgi:membrane-associated PAP2 superfamily phosphatase